MTGDIAEIMKKNGSGQGGTPLRSLAISPKGKPLHSCPLGGAEPPRVTLVSRQD